LNLASLAGWSSMPLKLAARRMHSTFGMHHLPATRTLGLITAKV
jgi:hypothetical protein